MKFKSVFLFLLLVLPVSVYLFLQAFGENHFDIPVYFEDGISSPLNECVKVDSGQYRAKYLSSFDSSILNIEGNKATVYGLGLVDIGADNALKTNLHTFLNKYKNEQRVLFASLSVDSLDQKEFAQYQNAVFLTLSESKIMEYGRCVLQVDLKNDKLSKKLMGRQLVLCDSERRIRGYYDPFELKEIDRLNTELYILLNE